MKALTLTQPWADAIAHGTKRIENRSWAPPVWLVGQRIMLHAGKTYDPMSRLIIDRQELARWPDVRGAITATALLTGYHRGDGRCCPLWGAPNVWHWQLDHVLPLADPAPCTGALRLWTPIPAVHDAVTTQIPHTTMTF